MEEDFGNQKRPLSVSPEDQQSTKSMKIEMLLKPKRTIYQTSEVSRPENRISN